MLNPAIELEHQTNTASLVAALADYATGFAIADTAAIQTARHCLIDALGGGLEALRHPECAALIGPLVPGSMMPGGARVPGTSLELDPAQAAFCIELMLCRSASPAVGALLAVADYQGRKAIMEGKSPPKLRDVLAAMIKTVEIQRVLAAAGMTARLARIAAVTSLVTAQLGGALRQIATALSYACADGGMQIETEWARADATGRAVRYACQAIAVGSSYLTPADADPVDLADRLIGGQSWRPEKSFGISTIDKLAASRGPLEVAELTKKFQSAVERHFPARQGERIKALFAAPERLDDLPVNELLAVLVTNGAR
jgi:2-methylcitrate dehydratase